jgi:nicotinamide phosphoribosyltransferase
MRFAPVGFGINPLLRTDSYKLDHRRQYPEGTEYVYSNFTNRGSRVPGINHVVNFGLQAYLTDLQNSFTAFFRTPTAAVVEDYKRKTSSFAPSNLTLDHIVDLKNLGYLPLEFRAIPEGYLVPLRVPTLTVENTHPEFAWLVNYIETDLSASIWHPQTSATTAWHFRRLLEKGAERTADSNAYVDFQAHDFSYRGMVNWQAAAASGTAHLLSFRGSDVLPVIDYVEAHYPGTEGLIGASVPATEHSVMCAGGQEDEEGTFRRLLSLYPDGIVSVVSDTWDFFGVLTNLLPKLKGEILARDGKLVIRPDSGDPVDIVCGTDEVHGSFTASGAEGLFSYLHSSHLGSAVRSPEQKGAVELLWEVFGGTVNEKGYKVLDPHIGLIYGDSITYDRAEQIIDRLARKGFSAENIVFGVGSYTYQMVTRDTFGSAVKATQVVVNGGVRNIQKNPKTDSGLKKSATGKLAVLTGMDGQMYLVEQANAYQLEASLLRTVFKDGQFTRVFSLDEVRQNLVLSTEILERAGALS